MKKRTLLTETKLYNVVESCITLEQLEVAEKYVKLAEKHTEYLHRTTLPFIRDIIKFRKIKLNNLEL